MFSEPSDSRGISIRTPPGGRVWAMTLVVIGAFAATGCWQLRDGLQPIELASHTEEVDETMARLDRVEEAMESELLQLETERAAFFDAPDQRWGDPFPLDLFKHTAMACLNEPFSNPAPDPDLERVAKSVGISCVVSPTPLLLGSLRDTPQLRDDALTKLQMIDGLRTLRARLQSRLRQLPTIIQRARAYLDVRRREAREMEQELRRRRPEYARRDFDESLERIGEYRRRLDQLDAAIAGVENSVGDWSKTLGTTIEAIYQDLSRLGRA